MKKLIFIFAILLTSCGARKVAVNNTETKTDSTAITEIIVRDSVKKEVEKATTVTSLNEYEEVELCPIDTSKAIVIDGKEYKNVIIRAKKNKTSNSYTNFAKVSETRSMDSISKSIVSKKDTAIIKTKNVDKKEATGLNSLWWILIILLVLLALRFIYSYTKPFN